MEIIPIKNGQMFKANFTYEAQKYPLDLDKDKVMGIDLGVNNFTTIVTTEDAIHRVQEKIKKSNGSVPNAVGLPINLIFFQWVVLQRLVG